MAVKELRRSPAFVPLILYATVFTVYAATAARSTVLGDPSEYQFIPAILGIAHPPGYAFYTLLAWLWQRVVAVGSVAYRTHLLACAAGAWVVTAVYLIVRDLAGGRTAASGDRVPGAASTWASVVASLFAALSLAAAPDLWQHAAHSNAHVVSVALTTTHLWLLLRWWRSGRDGWLYACAAVAGLAVTHHPVTVMGFPAYVLFVLAVRPRILLEGRRLMALGACLALGLAPYLYFVLRSPSAPFGPTNMNTWDGFLGHATGRGLRVNLFHFGLADQVDRLRVFWSLLRLQYALPVVGVALAGAGWLVRRRARVALLLPVFVLLHLAFTLNTVQDVMAYLLIPFAGIAVLAGAGALALIEVGASLLQRNARGHAATGGTVTRAAAENGLAALVLALLLLPWPLVRAGQNLVRGISLRGYDDAERYVEAVYARFAGRGAGAFLLSDWEHLTPLWYHIYVEGKLLDPADVTLVYVASGSANPWVDAAWGYLATGQPVYLSTYRPQLRDAGLRLRPEGPFYRVLLPPATAAAVPQYPLDVWVGQPGRVHLSGYDLPTTTVRAGSPLPITLYTGAPLTLTSYLMPYARLCPSPGPCSTGTGTVEQRWTTDSRQNTPAWLPGETIAEPYEVLVPFQAVPGAYTLELGYADLSGGVPELPLSSGGTAVVLGEVVVLPAAAPPAADLDGVLANLGNQIGLVEARAAAAGQRRRAPWQEPLTVRAGQALHLTLRWQALDSPRDSYTVFIHVLDAASGQPVYGHDYTPLGGAFPTYLWFPKWLRGQQVDDPYRLVLPPDLPPGDYLLEVGMYGMTSLRRLPLLDPAGNLAGDRVILGPLRVEVP